MAPEVVTAGESHGPALTAIVVGLPAGLRPGTEAIDADLRRRQQGYGRSTRRTRVVRNRDHANGTWGMSPWPPEVAPSGKGVKPVTLPRPGHADLAGVLKYGHEDVRNALE